MQQNERMHFEKLYKSNKSVTFWAENRVLFYGPNFIFSVVVKVMLTALTQGFDFVIYELEV